MNTNFILIFYYLVDEQRKYVSLPRYISKKHFISIFLLEFAVVWQMEKRLLLTLIMDLLPEVFGVGGEFLSGSDMPGK